jgi:6-phosphogluconolactonase
MEIPVAKLHVSSTAEEAYQNMARFVAGLAEQTPAAQGRFTIALSGGSTPRRLYEILASPPYAEGMAWDRWHIFWGDERCVPPNHVASNYRMAREALMDHVSVPDEHVHRMRGEAVPQEAAGEYEAVVREVFQETLPSFDLILLGIGDDGHTASLFPGTRPLQEKDRLVEAMTRAGWVDRSRLDVARLMFEKMLSYANHLGLYAEETGPNGEGLGNFPQAFTHLALISAAFNLDRVLEKGGRV